MHNSIDTIHKLKKRGENIEFSMKYNVRQHHWLTKTIPCSRNVTATETGTQDQPELPHTQTHMPLSR